MASNDAGAPHPAGVPTGVDMAWPPGSAGGYKPSPRWGPRPRTPQGSRYVTPAETGGP